MQNWTKHKNNDMQSFFFLNKISTHWAWFSYWLLNTIWTINSMKKIKIFKIHRSDSDFEDKDRGMI